MTNDKLSELIAQVESISPNLANYWQATAIVESIGYTDRIIEKEFGFPDALSIGKYIYEHHHSTSPVAEKPIPPKIGFAEKIIREIYTFIEQFSRSFVYAVPLIVLLLLGDVGGVSTTKLIPPQLASLFTIATLGSLIASGGFVQMICRRGEFYLGLGFPMQAQRVCTSLLGIGITTNIILSLVGLWFGFYRGLFADEYLILAACYYLLLSILWMLLAALSLQWRWGTPISLLGLTALFVLLRFLLKIGSLEAQIVAMFVTLVVVTAAIVIKFMTNKASNPVNREIKLPNLSATVYLLAPYFCYGISYFSFIFSDRMVAGWAISPSSGLIFAIDSEYQQSMDLALLNFLLVVPLIEYLAYKFIRYWYKHADVFTSRRIPVFSKNLRHRYWLIIIVTLLFFCSLVGLTIGVVKPWLNWSKIDDFQVLIACLGYLFFVIGLLNAIVLFSLNRAMLVLKTLLPGLIINFLVGYILANLIAVPFAVIGLVFGSAVFMLLSSRHVLQAIKQPDYAYYLGGY